MTLTIQGEDQPLAGRRVAFVGRLGGVNRRQAQQIVRQHGGTPVDQADNDVDLVVIGAEEFPLGDELLIQDPVREAAARGAVEIVTETQLWQRLGLVDDPPELHRLYTPAMLAELLHVSVAVIRRWHRRGLIVPVREVHRLPYFDFQEVATARRLAQLLAAGASPPAIEKKLAELARFLPEIERPLAQLSIIVEGQQILLRQGEGLVEPGGQLRIDFELLDEQHGDEFPPSPQTLPPPARNNILSLEDWRAALTEPASPDEMLELAAQLEERGEFESAAEMYRATLAMVGPNAEVSFMLAELLYRLGDVTAARERYYMAVEIDEDYVEARANLGCVLAETGQPELAVAAFEGALRYHEDYPDVHYHLARTLDDLLRPDEAESHWVRYLELAPSSPWAAEARERLAKPL